LLFRKNDMSDYFEKTQQAVVLYAKQTRSGERTRYIDPILHIKSKNLPEKPSPGMVRLEMSYVGICGTDIELVSTNPATNEIRSSVPLEIGMDGRIIGHEGIGRVIDTGDSRTGFTIGEWAVPSSVLNCGNCGPCLAGMPNQCRNAKLLGTQIDGLFADIVDIPGKLLVNMTGYIRNPEDIFALSALEPAATSLQACERALMKQSDRVIVFGAGPIGAYCAMLAKLVYGCRSVSVVEPSEDRRTRISLWADELSASLSDIGASGTYDVLIEASGHLENLSRLFPQLDPGARAVLLARSGEPLMLDHVDHMITNAVSITGCRGQLGGYMNRVAELYTRGVVPLGALMDCVGEGIGTVKKLLENSEAIRVRHCKSIIKLR
jgi:threonine dehydrogenase-like Zn-dependent dehydrogenase